MTTAPVLPARLERHAADSWRRHAKSLAEQLVMQLALTPAQVRAQARRTCPIAALIDADGGVAEPYALVKLVARHVSRSDTLVLVPALGPRWAVVELRSPALARRPYVPTPMALREQWWAPLSRFGLSALMERISCRRGVRFWFRWVADQPATAVAAHVRDAITAVRTEPWIDGAADPAVILPSTEHLVPLVGGWRAHHEWDRGGEDRGAAARLVPVSRADATSWWFGTLAVEALRSWRPSRPVSSC